ncbi:MAG: cytochrome P450 [Nostoc sp.]|uniref:cytochrome P450 n=1 Tax=Nostoc sp. TaxID=1180 RepID=UPI002FF4E292
MKSYQIPPGSFGIPVLGETLSFVFDRDFAKKRYRQYGPIFKTHLLGRPTVVMVGPEALELVLSSQMENFSWREGWPDNFKILLGESLFLQDGEEHRRNRRLIMPALHGPALANYVSTMEDITRGYLQKWEKQQEFTIKDFEFKGYHVPAGWRLLYSIVTTRSLKEIYLEPERFDPERFSPQRQEHKKYPFSLVGFGGGPRICIGIAFAKMEMKIIAAHLLRNYHWEILPNQSLEAVLVPSNRPKDGLQVRFQPR